MKEVLITSSALILAILVIRQIFKSSLSCRARYALWALVLVRLLIPVSLPAADFSVLTAAEPAQTVVNTRLEQIVPGVPARLSPVRPDGEQPVQALSPDISRDRIQDEGPLPQMAEPGELPKPNNLTLGEVLTLIWKAGMVLMGTFFLLSNLAFWLKLRKSRRTFEADTARRVYLVDEGVLPSPCLFGLFRPAVYLTPAAASAESLRHVLTHEETHARHLDPLWSLLRCVCLTVYWFDPLVWVAAHCSKADCELACDEGVLAKLGESQRVPYGRTLLSLIPVRHGGNPMLTATTMTAGKRQLKDRITRIAQKPRQLAAAAVAVALLAAIAAACTFTGGKPAETPAPAESAPAESSQLPYPEGGGPLTGEELRWFNEEFFNSSATEFYDEDEPTLYNLRNQFANPINLYERPEDIDLFELFYCEGVSPSREEYRAIFDMDPEDAPCPAYKLTTAEMDAILTEHTGLTLAETNRVGLNHFTYDEHTDAYYWQHGDTNYPGDIEFLYGAVGPVGDEYHVELYYEDTFYRGGWRQITLKVQDGGGYLFLSNVECDQPAIPPARVVESLPNVERTATISLDDLEPYAAPTVTLTDYPNHYSFHYTTCYANWDFDGRHVMVYQADDGVIYAAWEENDVYHVFLDHLTEAVEVSFFHDLFGRAGFYVGYYGPYSEYEYGPIWDYYYFTDDGILALLARCETHAEGDPRVIDLDGDGKNELATPRQIFYERDGLVYEAKLDDLLLASCPELNYVDWARWDFYARSLTVVGYNEAQWTRQLYFTGDELLVYRIDPAYADHMVAGADEGIPAEVVSAAKDFVLTHLEEQGDGTYLDVHWREQDEGRRPTYDDWRVTYFDGPYDYTFGDVTIRGWSFNYECHTTTPDKVVLAGGRYMTEDGWVSPGYPGCDYLFFRVEEDGGYTFLLRTFSNEGGPGSRLFDAELYEELEELGVDIGGTTYAALQAQNDLDSMLDGSQVLLSLVPADGAGGGSYAVDPAEGNGPFYRHYFTQPDSYRWSYLESFPGYPEGTYLTIASPDWYDVFQFWEGSDLVMYKRSNQGAVWYRVESLMHPDSMFYDNSRIFHFMREWFDEAELAARQGDGVVSGLSAAVPVDLDDKVSIATAWASQYEEAKLHLTPGSDYACTYVKVTGVEIWEDQPEAWFPTDVLPYEHFAFSYTTVFVPADENVLNRLMAGNTGEYTGSDPVVPQGAWEYSRMGAMYLTGDGWRCDGVGTG